MISACDYNAIANGVGYYSFTKELTTELRELSKRPSFPVAHLFRNIFSRIQARRPDDGKTQHPAPVHFSLTQDNPDYPRSIQLSVLPGHIKKPESSNQDLSICAQVVESDSGDPERGRGSTLSSPARTEQLINDTMEAFPAKLISNLSMQKPRILLAVRLRDDCRGGELSVGQFKNWLRDMPAVAEEVKVEAGFGSFSSIVIVSIPLTLSLYLPRDPAIINIGPITSENLLQQSVHPGRKTLIQEWKARLISAIVQLKPILLPPFLDQLQQGTVIGIVGIERLVRSIVEVTMVIISQFGIIKLAGILTLLVVAIAVVLEVTDHYISTSKGYRLLADKSACLWERHFSGRVATESGSPAPGVPFNSKRVGRPSHSHIPAIVEGDHRSIKRSDAAQAITPHTLALQKRILAAERGSAPNRTPRRIHSHDIVAKQNTFVYRDIDDHREIRLLKIIPGVPDAPLEVMMFASVLRPTTDSTLSSNSQVCKYTALSYHWGQDEPRNQIRIYRQTDVQSDVQQKMSSFAFETFYVQDNLNAALRQFRDRDHDVTLWIDAICIDQNNHSEKAAQITRIHEIYEQANEVCVWLGTGTAQAKETFQFMRDILDLQTLDHIIEKKETQRWMLVINLMKNSWFSRRWVIQELALAKRAYVKWGEEQMEWSNFADAIALFMTKYESIQQILNTPNTQSSSSPTDIMEARGLGAELLVQATSNLFRKEDNGRILQRLMNLETLVSSMFLSSETLDPKDTIFAVLSLAKDTFAAPELRIRHAGPGSTGDGLDILRKAFNYVTFRLNSLASFVLDPFVSTSQQVLPNRNYSRITTNNDKTLAEVCIDFVEYCIETSQSLDILCRHWAPNPGSNKLRISESESKKDREKLPTWIGRIDGHAFSISNGAFSGRVNGDSLVSGVERGRRQYYDASAGLKPFVTFGKCHIKLTDDDQDSGIEMDFSDDDSWSIEYASKTWIDTSIIPKPPRKFDGTMHVKGFVLAIIEQTTPRVLNGIIPSEAFEYGGWPEIDGDVQTVPEQLWRTLVGDRGPDGTNPPSWYRRACLACLTSCMDVKGDLNAPEVISREDVPRTVKTFLERVRAVTWGRRFFTSRVSSNSERQSLFGLAPHDSSEDDVICILFGCSVPVVLRKVRSGRYIFIGECYVHGMMDGEAVTLPRRPEYPYYRTKGFTLI
jgi:hypothetical protein